VILDRDGVQPERVRVSRSVVGSAKLRLTGDSHDYIKALQQVVDEARS
jgi:hypothetical protein